MLKEMGLTQENAQKLMDFHAKQIQAITKAPSDTLTEMRTQWKTELAKDPAIAGKDAEVKATIGRGIDALGDAKLAEEFRNVMDFTGVGDNPAFVKAMFKFGQLVSEGRPVVPGNPSVHGQSQPGSGPVNAANALYPNLR